MSAMMQMYGQSGGSILTWTMRQRDHREDTVAGCRVKRRKHCEQETEGQEEVQRGERRTEEEQ